MFPNFTPRTPTVFIDRDGVLIEDVDLLTDPAEVRLLPGVAAAVRSLHESGFLTFVVSNQSVVARGLATPQDVEEVHAHVQGLLRQQADAQLDGFYYCPHHPNANLVEYRAECDCRKPRAGMLRQAALEHRCELSRRSVMIGDRLTDIVAGHHAGCSTVLVETGRHDDPLIETPDAIDRDIRPDFICPDFPSAVAWILERGSSEASR